MTAGDAAREPALLPALPGGSGALTAALRSELDALLSETRHRAVLEALDAWREDPERPREGVLALERMAAVGPQPQTFDWPDLDYPATLAEVCGDACSSTIFGGTFSDSGPRQPSLSLSSPYAPGPVAAPLPPTSASASYASGGALSSRSAPLRGVPAGIRPSSSLAAPYGATSTPPRPRGLGEPAALGGSGGAGGGEAPESAVMSVLAGFGQERQQQLMAQLNARVAFATAGYGGSAASASRGPA